MLCRVSKPHETPTVCGQPDLAALFDVIKLTACTGLILQALGLPHLGRVCETLPFTPAPLATLQEPEPQQGWTGVTVPVCSQITELPAAGCPLQPEKKQKDVWTDGGYTINITPGLSCPAVCIRTAPPAPRASKQHQAGPQHPHGNIRLHIYMSTYAYRFAHTHCCCKHSAGTPRVNLNTLPSLIGSH